METELSKNKPVRKYVIISLWSLLLAFLFYYGIMSILATTAFHKHLRDNYGFQKTEKNKAESNFLSDSAYLALVREKSFLQSRTILAESDSIYLTVSLPDSLIHLEISGVSVNITRISNYSADRIFRDRFSYTVSSMLARPLSIESNIASIPKEPLMIKMAPKDTSEYKPDIAPDTADYEPVNFILELDNGMVIQMYQQEKINRGDRRHLFFFDLRYRAMVVWRSLKKIAVGKVPVYQPRIKLRIPRTDAKIIFRALPVHGQITVYR